MIQDFPQTVCYKRFVELMQSALMSMTIFAKTCCLVSCTGISFIDSTPIRVCKNKRIKRNKVFKDIATTGKSTMGWLHGFKLHIIINDKGELLSFCVTQTNVDDREPLKNEAFLQSIFGKLFGDKGYMSEKLTQLLFVDGIQLITSRQGFHKRMNFIQKESLQFELILKEVRKIRKTQLKYETLEVFKGFHKFFLENNIKMGSSGSLNL
ncbi:IS982 family transposase [Empedobacter falsenii]